MSRPYWSVKDTLFVIRLSPKLFLIFREERKAKSEKALQFQRCWKRNTGRDTSTASATPRFLSKHGRRGRFLPHPRSRFAGYRHRAIGIPLGHGGRKQHLSL